MKTMLVALALVTLLLAPTVAPVLAADEAKEAIDKFEDETKHADAATKVRMMEELQKAYPENEKAAKAISKLVGDRDLDVRIAAIKTLGTYKMKKYLGMYMGLIKRSDDEPKVMEAALLALGELGDRRAKKEVIDVAKKWLPKNSLVASAAATALGKIPDKESMEQLIKLLDLTYPHQAKDGPSVSTETRKILADSRPAIMAGLTDLTGWEFPDPRAWANFWERTQKRWKPGQEAPDLTKIEKWEDPGYGFKIEKPAKDWVFAKLEGTRISIKKEHETLTQAQVWIQSYDLTNYAAKTASQKLQDKMNDYKQRWKDVKEETIVRDQVRIGRDKGERHRFTGMDTRGNVMNVTDICIVKDSFMYVINGWVRSGLDKKLTEELEECLDSFEFTY